MIESINKLRNELLVKLWVHNRQTKLNKLDILERETISFIEAISTADSIFLIDHRLRHYLKFLKVNHESIYDEFSNLAAEEVHKQYCRYSLSLFQNNNLMPILEEIRRGTSGVIHKTS